MKRKILHPGAARWAAGLAVLLAGSRASATPNPGVHWATPRPGGAGLFVASARHAVTYENVLGTTLEIRVAGTQADLARAESAALAAIDALAAEISTYDPSSTIRRLMAGTETPTGDVAEILGLYDVWTGRTNGAINVNLGAVKRLWSSATDAAPTARALADAHAMPRAWNVDALGKALAVDRAVAAAQSAGVRSGLINLGGDLRAWGDAAWPVDVLDGAAGDDGNVIATVWLRDAAIATSGSGMRPMTVAGKPMSHLIDPATLQPVREMARGASAMARDCVTANALATAAAVRGTGVVAAMAEWSMGYVITSAGTPVAAGGGLADGVGAAAPAPATKPSTRPATKPVAAAGWPAPVRIGINLKTPDSGRRVKRPYVAVWAEDANGKVVRTIAVWGNEGKYIPDLSEWFRAIGSDRQFARSVSAATRSAGKYNVTWDGKDDAGKLLPRGTYKIHVEINREHGRHVSTVAEIKTDAPTIKAVLNATAESDQSDISYAAPAAGASR